MRHGAFGERTLPFWRDPLCRVPNTAAAARPTGESAAHFVPGPASRAEIFRVDGAGASRYSEPVAKLREPQETC